MFKIKLLKSISQVLIFGLIFFGFTMPAHAQLDKWKKKIGKSAENKAEEKVEEKTGEAVDKTIDKAFDKLFKKVEEAIEGDKKDETTEGSKTEKGSTGKESKDSDSKVTIKPSEPDPNVEPSSWIGSYRMRTEETDKKGKMTEGFPQTNTFYIEKYKIAFENKADDRKEQATVIIDRQYRQMTTKMIDEDGTKQAITLPLPSMTVEVEDTDGDINESRDNFKKTGRTKTIAGYKCEEYTYENDEVNSSIWLAPNMGADFREFFSWVSIKDNKKGGYTSYDEFYPFSGAIMESTSLDKESGKETHMIVEDVSKGSVNPEIFSLDGYEHQDMNGLLNSPEGKKLSELFKKITDEDDN
ncbi:MAG: DUF4412 domain-containing protein [Bacteroidia bacterium]|nr:DUF4412 domain-containing protein [Bacteroidia bacterium]